MNEEAKPPERVEEYEEPPSSPFCGEAQLHQSHTDRVSVGLGVSILSWCKELLVGGHLCYHYPGVGLRHKLPILVSDRIIF